MSFEKDMMELLGISLTSSQIEQFSQYFEFLIEYNKITNLTRITEKDEVYYKHFYDSVTLINTLDFKNMVTLCDMGAGAGFPSIPLKIVFPHLKVTIIDSLGKRITFLKQLVERLGLHDVWINHDRNELFAVKHQQEYDVVTARALGQLSLILEMGIPMLKVGGFFIAPKGGNCDDEIKESENALHTLGGEIKKIIRFDLPHQFGQRTNILVQKVKHIKGYPRTFTQMSHKAL